MIAAANRRVWIAVLLALSGVLVALGVVFFLINHQISVRLSQQMAMELNRDRVMLEALHRVRGAAGIERALPRMLELDPEQRFALYLDRQGRRIAGNLRTWPAQLEGGRVDQDVRVDGVHLHVASAGFADGTRLLIGERHDHLPMLNLSSVLTAVVSLFIMLLAGAAVGLQFHRYIVDRISAVLATASQIMRGQMMARVPDARVGGAFGQLSRTLNDMLDQNEAVVSGLRTVTDSLAHDLRTPLMRMGAAIGDARTTADAARRTACLERAEGEARYVLDTFSSLIDIARAESGLSREAMEPVDLAALANDAADLFDPVAADCGRRLLRRCEPAWAHAHRQVLFQALCNLIENALRHAPAGSDIELALEAGTNLRGPRFTVLDRGPGIPAGSREWAMQRFSGLGRASGPKGYGLGLAIAAAAARLHAGHLRLDDANPGLAARLELGREQFRGPGDGAERQGRYFGIVRRPLRTAQASALAGAPRS